MCSGNQDVYPINELNINPMMRRMMITLIQRGFIVAGFRVTMLGVRCGEMKIKCGYFVSGFIAV